MTGEGDARADKEPREPLDIARADLEHIRETVQRATRGEVQPEDLKDTLQNYWREHGPTVKDAASSLTEEVRLQVLGELYKWREQLSAQLQAPERSSRSSPQQIRNEES